LTIRYIAIGFRWYVKSAGADRPGADIERNRERRWEGITNTATAEAGGVGGTAKGRGLAGAT
jgi:hypothetical protein